MSTKGELREFLVSRRARLTPQEAGIDPGDGHRRVPGLRREELARLAGVSVDYYVRLEQGRNSSVSASVLDAVARALRLDEHERDHLFDLAKPATGGAAGAAGGGAAGRGGRGGPGGRRAASAPAARVQHVRVGVRVLLDTLQQPAFVLGRRLDVLASNRMARALLCDFDALPEGERNHARWVFLDPAARERYLDWEAIARDNVAMLRMDAGRHPDDAALSALIGELTIKSPAFARWWADHDVLRSSHGSKRYRHPVVGELTISYEALPLPEDPDQTLFLYSAEPGSRSAEALALLGSWSLDAAER